MVLGCFEAVKYLLSFRSKEDTASLKEATSIREAEAAKFRESNKDLIQSITNVKNAIQILGKHHKGAALPRCTFKIVASSLLRFTEGKTESAGMAQLITMFLRWVRRHPMPGIGCLGKFYIRCPGKRKTWIFGFSEIRIFG